MALLSTTSRSLFYCIGTKHKFLTRCFTTTQHSPTPHKLVRTSVPSLCSRFRVPSSKDQWDILSTSTVFCVATRPKGKYKPRLHFLSTTHVTHPFLFPKYYPSPTYDWVHSLRIDDVNASLQFHEEGTDKILLEVPMLPSPCILKNLVVLHLRPEHEEDDALQEKLESMLKIFELSEHYPMEEQPVIFLGHLVEKNVSYPMDMTGAVNVITKNRIFAYVDAPPMPMGMCGGPVVLPDDNNKCIGMVEASVSAVSTPRENEPEEEKKFRALVQNNAVFIPSTVLATFLQKQECVPTLARQHSAFSNMFRHGLKPYAFAATRWMSSEVAKGLAGVNVAESAICTVGVSGIGLNYRGFGIDDLAQNCSFEEVAHLLIHGRLPTRDELKTYTRLLASMRELPTPVKEVLERIPSQAHPMDVIRTGASVLGTVEPEGANNNEYQVANRLVASFGSMLLYWHHWIASGKRITTSTKPDDSTAVHFLKLLNDSKDEPNPLHSKVLDVSLVLYAEHDLAASTFAARITASTLSDIYSSIITGIGTLRGPLHGGANEAAMNLLDQFKTTKEADAGVRALFDKKEIVMGFGHRVYKKGDPRNGIIKSLSKKLSEEKGGNPNLFAISEHVEKLMLDEKKMFPNLDIIEQRKNNKLIRPSAKYIGPQPTAFVPLDKRVKA